MSKKIIWSVLGLTTVISLLLMSFSPCINASGAGNNFWDKFGEPQYGGTLIFTMPRIDQNWDVTHYNGSEALCFLETLWVGDWTADRENAYSVYPPDEYYNGELAESWEIIDPRTEIVHIRKGVHWQDKEPVNGREFVANDVKEHYDRLMGKGRYTEPIAFFIPETSNLESVSVIDKYTVEFKLKKGSTFSFRRLQRRYVVNRIEAPEALDMEGGALKDWKKAVGTGPWMLTDYVSGSTITFSKNPNYWGYDQRHPNNKVPYADEMKWIGIADEATTLAALRTGKIHVLGGDNNHGLDPVKAQTLMKSNPDLVYRKFPYYADALLLRVDKTPFSDIKVRKAMNMSVDRKTVAKQYYQGEIEGNPAGRYLPTAPGYIVPYDEWPQDLKDEYSYNPEGAKKLLAEAGYPDGFKVKAISPAGVAPELLQIFKSYFMDIGVDMEINEMPFPNFITMAQKGGDHNMSWWKSATFFGVGSYITGSGMNLVRVSDPVYDKLADEFDGAPTDAEFRKASRAIDLYFPQQHWVVHNCPSVLYVFWQPYLKGYSGENLYQEISHIWARSWIDHSLKKSMGH